MKESLRIVTTDSYVLNANRFSPDQPNDKVVLINSATGVKQKYYFDFASFLSEQGFTVYTYDYRGVGESRPKSLRGFSASMKDWGSRDYHSMLHNILQSHRESKVIVIGHSVGGQLAGFSGLSKKVDAFLMVGSQTPFIGNFSGSLRKLKLTFFWNLLLPISTAIAGYFPAKKFGLFEDLPRGVALQWARWAKTDRYVFEESPEDEPGFHALTPPALMISFSDDDIAPPLAVKDLMKHYANLKWSHWQLKPEEVMQKSIGHFGYFRKNMRDSLWNESVQWLQKVTRPSSRKAA